MVIIIEGLPTMLLDPLVLCSLEITWQTKTFKSTLPRCLLLPNLAGVWLTMRGPTHKVTWLFDHVILQDHVTNLKHLNYHDIYVHTTLQEDDLSWTASIRKVVWSYNHLVGLARSHDRPKTYLHRHNGYGHKNWLGDDLPWVASSYKVTWPFNHVILSDCMAI